MLQFLYALIALASLIAVYRWTWGVGAALVVGLVQDPLRKMIPDAPGFLAMASLPVWLAVMASAIFARQVQVHVFLDRFPRLGQRLGWFALYLMVPAAISATYSSSSWMITVLGALIYGTALLALVAGWFYPDGEAARVGLLRFYAVVASLALLGGPLEYYGWADRWAAVGTQALGHVWVTHRTGTALYMIAGFFRSPDVMGWHACLVFMIAAVMALRARGATRAAWMILAVWGLLNVWLCGRRKMLSMVPVFLGCYLFLIFRFRDVRRFLPALGILLMTLGLGWYLVASLSIKTEVQAFYLTTLQEADTQFKRHGWDSVVDTVRQAGWLGYGLGMGQQGTHHLKVQKPRLWQESGPTKLVAELGVPGSLLFLAMLFTLLVTALHVIRAGAASSSFYVTAGLASIVAANLISAIVSAQIYGDPFVALLLSLMVGLMLAGARLARPPEGAAP